MKNLVGPESFAAWPALAAMPAVALHLYGKAEVREGRKLGHATHLLAPGTVSKAQDPGRFAPV
jgi:5-(carboxyamino)imidazole ribonucleotide synthase